MGDLKMLFLYPSVFYEFYTSCIAFTKERRKKKHFKKETEQTTPFNGSSRINGIGSLALSTNSVKLCGY